MKRFRTVYGDLLSILSPKAKRFVLAYAVLLSVLAILDAASLGLLALIVTPIASGGSAVVPIIGKVEGIGTWRTVV